MYSSGGQPLTQYIDGQWYDTYYSARGSWQTTTEVQCPSSNFPLEGRLEDATANFPREGRPAPKHEQRGGTLPQLLSDIAVGAGRGPSAESGAESSQPGLCAGDLPRQTESGTSVPATGEAGRAGRPENEDEE